MISTTHPVAPEDLMALLDGELAPEEARSVSAHLEQCAECAQLADQFRSLSNALAAWTVPDTPAALGESVLRQAANAAPSSAMQIGQHRPSWTSRPWMLGGVSALAAVFILSLALVFFPTVGSQRHMAPISPSANSALTTQQSLAPQFAPALPTMNSVASRDEFASSGVTAKPSAPQTRVLHETASRRSSAVGASGPSHLWTGEAVQRSASAPMIARTVSLSIIVKDISTARSALDSILLHYQGYSTQLTVNTEENAQRTVQASLRIPAPQLAAALADLKSLGRVETETQSGEEVTQQHADLVARLQNSRETEQRLRDILSQRTGKIEDVLQVEEEIARVRGEIESMQAEQAALDHRVDFATIDLRLAEDLKVQFTPPSPSASTQIRNSFVSGIRNALATLLGLLLFFEEAAPVLLVWLTILAVPAFFLWRRYRRIHQAS